MFLVILFVFVWLCRYAIHL